MNKKELICYGTDASRIIGSLEGVFFPKNIEEVQAIIKNSESDIVPRGAGTGIQGGSIPNNSIIVDLCKMNKILEFNPSKISVKVEAGITIKELNERLKKANFEFPIYSGNQISTFGGAIAINSSGDRTMKYGTVRDWVEEVQFVNGKGELVKTSKADLMDVCGMEGITGIIVNAVLRLAPIIKRSVSIFQTDSLDEAVSIGRRVKGEQEVCMARLLSKKVSKILGFPEKYHLIVEFGSDRGKVKAEEYENIIKTIRDADKFLISDGYYTIEDSKMFLDKVKEFILFLEYNNIPYYSDLGFGIVYAFFKDNEKIKKKETRNLMIKFKTKPGKFGIGINRKDIVDSFDAKITQRIKMRHDPQNKMNKGKLIDVNYSIGKTEISDIKRKEEIKNEVANLDKSESKGSSNKSEGKASSDKSEGHKKTSPNLGEEKSASEFIRQLEKEVIEKKKEPAQSVDYSLIKNIMTNKFKKNDNENNSVKDGGNNNDKP